ncbi:MAG: site-2 protease family protein [Anaerolineales bacterium]|nr:site-2 protease family protein [Anaerolineales bacterium]
MERSPVELADRLRPLVEEVMHLSDVTLGNEQLGFAVRFRGELLRGSEEAFDRLDPSFAREGATLLFRKEDGQDTVLALSGVINPDPSNALVNAALFVLTLASMVFAGALYGLEGPIDQSSGGIFRAIVANIPNGLVFAGSLFAILGAHEFGHYLAARYHKCAVTLPYFLPFPGSLFGTLGAFIRLKEPPRNRKVLLDIGLSGPLAGLVVAIPILLIGLATSPLGSLPLNLAAETGSIQEGNSLLYLAAKFVTKGALLPEPLHYAGLSPVVYWIQYYFLGTPTPFGGTDVFLNHMAWAGWAGLLVTALNLIPAGQLDGGHTIYVLVGDTARRIWPLIVVALVLLGFVWSGWYLWAVMIFLLGKTYAQPRDEITTLDPKRRALAIFGLIVFVLVFIPVPLRVFGG